MLGFRILGIPVGVHLTFLFVALLGAASYRGVDIAIWTAAAFTSILGHELGHALVARAFDARGVTITLYGLGGLTSYAHGRGMTHWRSFLVSAAGSAVGIVLGGSVWLIARTGAFDGVPHEVAVFIDSFVFTALIWGVLNWIPIVPLDGGHMVQHLAAMIDERRAPLIGQIVTWSAVAIVVPVAWVNGYRFAALIVVFFAFAGLREFQDQNRAIRAADASAIEEESPSNDDGAPSIGPPPSPDRSSGDGRPPATDVRPSEAGTEYREPPRFPI
jgi:stage IV sporulation protein FB